MSRPDPNQKVNKILFIILGIAGILSPEYASPGGTKFEKSPAVINPDKVPGDTTAIRIFNEMVNAMYNARTLSYECKHIYESEEGKFINTYKIMLKKPNYSYVETFDERDKLGGVLIGDGDQFWLRWPEGSEIYYGGKSPMTIGKKDYMRKPSLKGYSSIGHELTSLLITGLPVLNPSVFHGYPDYPSSYADSIVYKGMEKIGDEDFYLIWVRLYKVQRVRCLWVSPKDHLPRKLVDSIKVARQVVLEEKWDKIKINEEIPDKRFKWKPPKDWREIKPPEGEELLLKPGEKAPDFSLRSISKDTISLSDFKGKVVILFFWKVGCPPCREVFPEMQKLYEKFRDKGLVILGFNTVDDEKITLNYMREYSITFPTVLDNSKKAWKVMSEEYGSMAFPTFFVIDREGKIAESIWGYSKENYERILKAIEKLRIR